MDEEKDNFNENEEIYEENIDNTESVEPEELSDTELNTSEETIAPPKKKKKFLKILLIILLLLALIIGGALFYYSSCLKPVSNEKNEIIVTIEKGSSVAQIAETLEESGIIKNALVFRIFVKQTGENNIQAGTYKLYTNMSVKEIYNKINEGSSYNPETINITFLEGKNMRWIAKKISTETNNSYESVFELLEDEEYITSLINKYWFLSNIIKSDSIYYPLEGYLFPNTYNFRDKNVTVETIFETMLDEMDKQLTPYKEDIEKSDYTVHEILSLASVIELEGPSKSSRANIASVFYNRLDANMSLGSDVTTYYAIKVDMSERDLYRSEINAYNPYNTRGPGMAGKLPVGPIASCSLESIKAAINPGLTDYLYFVADKNGKIYFTRSSEEHNRKVSELKSSGLWYTYE